MHVSVPATDRGQSLSWQCGNVDSEKRALSSVHSPTCRTKQLLLGENDPRTEQVTSTKVFLFFNVVIKLLEHINVCIKLYNSIEE